MSKNVFILGAGASKEVGAPLMHDFLDVAENLSRQGKVEAYREQFELVADGRSALQATHSKSIGIDLYNMEAVFSAFEMAKMLGHLGEFDRSKVAAFPEAYRTVIAATLENTITYQADQGRIHPPPSYALLVDLIQDLRKSGSDSSILTFNYDLALDFTCHLKSIIPDYCLQGFISAPNALKTLKLHGSLNWTHCHTCQKIVAWELRDYFGVFSWRNPYDARELNLNLSQHLSKFSHCNNGMKSNAIPYLVPPTWNKSEHHHSIENVWQTAAKELSEAENIFVIGYSLPETDSFFQYLFSLGVTSKTLIRKFWVIDPNPSVEPRYRSLVGQAVKTRFKFIESTFTEGMREIRSALLRN